LPGEKPKQRAATNVIDLVSVLQKSLAEAGRSASTPTGKKPKRAAAKKRAQHKKAA
jgi:non-homologous end joining protein Ku